MSDQRRAPKSTVRLGDVFEVTQRLQDEAVEWYKLNHVPRTMRHLNKAVLRKAYQICGGDWRRCVYDPRDESITVWNNIMWVPEREDD